jgi:hypothetical protein
MFVHGNESAENVMMSYHAQLQRDGDILSSSGNNPR